MIWISSPQFQISSRQSQEMDGEEGEWNSWFRQRSHLRLAQLLHLPTAQSPCPAVLAPCGAPTAFWAASESCRTNCYGRRKMLHWAEWLHDVWLAVKLQRCLNFYHFLSALFEAIYLFQVIVLFPIAFGRCPLEYLILSSLLWKPSLSIQTQMLMWLPAMLIFLYFFYLQEGLRNCFAFKNRTTLTDNAFF